MAYGEADAEGRVRHAGADAAVGVVELSGVRFSKDRIVEIVRAVGYCIFVVGVWAAVLLGLSHLSHFFGDPYWERQIIIYDRLRDESRCVDSETGELSELKPPCLVLSIGGRDAVKNRIGSCVQSGTLLKVCEDEAWEWMRKQQPK